ncbi:MAG: hypothetical protein ACD_79C00102G0003 [uncultured bacterium]|nr:MAG: hypothetical protein ACD_79C00102G0003 [uncultured bacterium]
MNKSEYLWHYTTLEGLKGILENQNIWATDYRFLNDSTELHTAKEIFIRNLIPDIKEMILDDCSVNKENENIVKTHGGIDNLSRLDAQNVLQVFYDVLNDRFTTYLISFCSHTDDSEFIQNNGLLSQWRGYGKNGGFAILFNKEKLIELFEKEYDEYELFFCNQDKCIYNSPKPVSEVFKSALNNVNKLSARVYKHSKEWLTNNRLAATEEEIKSFNNCVSFLKHEAFKEESEHRFVIMKPNELIGKNKKEKEIHFRKKSGEKIPYIRVFENMGRLPIVKIIIGPHQDQKHFEISLKSFLNELGLNEIEIIKSEIPYREG